MITSYKMKRKNQFVWSLFNHNYVVIIGIERNLEFKTKSAPLNVTVGLEAKKTLTG